MPYQGRIPAKYPDTNYKYTLEQGTVDFPTLSFLNDSNNGLWSPAADNIAISTSGVERLRINDSLFNVKTNELEISGNTGWQILRIKPSTTGVSAIVDFSTSVATDADNPQWLVGQRYNGHGNLSFWRYTGGHQNNTLTIYRPEDSGSSQNRVDVNGILSFEFDNDTYIKRASSDTLTVYTAANERLRVDSSGNVGIGTSSPADKLSVNGYITESTDGGTTYWNVVTQQDIGTAANQVPLNQYLGSMAYQDSDFVTADKLYVTSILGIGTTTPTYKLQVTGGSTGGHFAIGDYAPRLVLDYKTPSTTTDAPTITSDGYSLYYYGRTGYSGQHIFHVGGSNSEVLRLDNNGRVGVGQSSVGSTRMHVKGHNSLNSSILLDVNTGDTTLAFAENGSEKWYIENVTSVNALRFYDVSSAAERLRINGSGQTLINTTTTSQTAPLVVNARDPGAGIYVNTGGGAGGGVSSPSYGLYVEGRAWNNATTQYGVYAKQIQQYVSPVYGGYFESENVYSNSYGVYTKSNYNDSATGINTYGLFATAVSSNVNNYTSNLSGIAHGAWIENTSTNQYVRSYGLTVSTAAGPYDIVPFRILHAGSTKLIFKPSTAANSSNVYGVLGINVSSPENNANALTISSPGDDPRPAVYITRGNNSGGGAGNPEIGLEVNIPNTYNSAGLVTGIKCFARHNLNYQHYAGYFEAGGGQYSSGIGVYAKVTHTDTNGGGWQPAIRAEAISNFNSSASGYAVGIHSITNDYTKNINARLESQYTGTDTQTCVLIVRNGSTVGSITTTTNSTAYNTSSDYRLKENIIPLENAIDRLKLIPVHRFNFISDPDKTVDGFIAHEVQPIVPESITGEKDEMETVLVLDEDGSAILDEDGDAVTEENPKYQSIDQSKLVPLLTAALQEAIAKIEELQTRLDNAGL